MKISIITINYNNSIGLKRTIKSVLSQTYKHYEYIIVDGASNDESLNILKKNVNKISHIIREPDNGIYEAMNKGIRIASGEYIIFMNSGDEFYANDTLEKCIIELKNDDFIVGDSWNIRADGNGCLWKMPDTIDLDYLMMHSLSHQSTFTKSYILKKYPYREDLGIVADWEQSLKQLVFKGCSYRHLPVCICCFYENGISQNKENVERERKKVLNEYFPKVLRQAVLGKTFLHAAFRREPANSTLYKIILFIYTFLLKIRKITDKFK